MAEPTTQEDTQQLPRIDFISYLNNLVATGQLYLEGIRDPETDEVVVNLGLVKGIIDTIEMLEEKTQGNLTAPEANFLANTLYELRMGYVRAISKPEVTEETETKAETSAEESAGEPSDNAPEAEAPTNEAENGS